MKKLFERIARNKWTALTSIALTIAVLSSIFTPIGIDIDKSTGEAVFTIGTTAHAAGTADFTCDGVDDNVQLQAALTALPAGGGKLIVLEGTYQWAALTTVSRAIDNVTIQGTGLGTIFNGDAVTALFSAGVQSDWVFRDFATDAGGVNIAGASSWTMQNVLLGAQYWAYRVDTTGIVNSEFSLPVGVGFPTTPAQGNLPYYNGTTWANLGVGSNGQVLVTQGAAANPAWDTIASSGGIIVAAAGASADEQALALMTGGTVCNGSNDQVNINTALAASDNVGLTSGTFTIEDDITPDSGDKLLGRTTIGTILDFSPSGASANISCITLSDVEIGYMTLTGTPLPTSQGTIYFQYTAGNGARIHIHDIYHDAANSTFSAFSIYVDTKRTISDVLFENIAVMNGDGNGFSHHGGADTDNIFRRITYRNIYVYRAGYAATRYGAFTTGFDLGTAAFTLEDILLENCVVEESWDSAYYCGENNTVKNRIIFVYCKAKNCGQKTPATWGSFNINNGYITLIGCEVEGGTNAQYKIHNGLDGEDFTSLINCRGLEGESEWS